MTEAPRWLTLQQAAAHTQLSPRTLRRAATRGDLFGVKVNGARWRFRLDRLDGWLESGHLSERKEVGVCPS